MLGQREKAMNAVMWHLYTHNGRASTRSLMNTGILSEAWVSKAVSMLMLDNKVGVYFESGKTMVVMK